MYIIHAGKVIHSSSKGQNRHTKQQKLQANNENGASVRQRVNVSSFISGGHALLLILEKTNSVNLSDLSIMQIHVGYMKY